MLNIENLESNYFVLKHFYSEQINILNYFFPACGHEQLLELLCKYDFSKEVVTELHFLPYMGFWYVTSNRLGKLSLFDR